MASTTTPDTPVDLDSLSSRFLAELDEEERTGTAEDDDQAGAELDETPDAATAGDPSDEDAPASGDRAAPSPEQPSPEEPTRPQAPPAGQTPAAPADGTQPPAGDQAPAPYTVRSGGKAHELAGVQAQPDGSLVVSKDGRQRVEEILRRGIHHETTWRAERQVYEQRLAEMQEEAAQGTALRDFFAGLLDKGPDAIAEFLDDFELNKRDLELKLREQELDRRQERGTQPSDAAADEATVAEVQEKVRSALPSDLEGIAAEDFPGLFEPDDLTAVAEALAPMTDRFYLIAERDFAPRELPPYLAAAYPRGVQRGELLLNVPELKRAVAAHAAPLQRHRQRAAAEAAKAKAALEANAKRNGAPGAREAPTVTVGDAASDPAPRKRKIESADDWRESLLDDDDD